MDDFNLPTDWKGFFGGVGSLGELFINKLDISITKDKEKYA